MKMRNKKIIALFIVALLSWKFSSNLKTYVFLLQFYLNSSTNSEAGKNFQLRQIIASASDANWNHIETSVIEKLQPREKAVITAKFTRGASLPTGEVILEFLTTECNQYCQKELAGYIVIVYATKKGNEYHKIDYFRKFIP
jgi:hypothetical protein